MMDKNYTRSGFTLIELSIVLVIIGLIVGGVLVGRDLIRTSELRSLATQVEEIERAMTTFKLKHDALPGDMANATEFWGTDPGGCPDTAANTIPHITTCNGNGDGTIGGLSTANNHESIRLWQHLANAGMIAGRFTGINNGGNSSSLYRVTVGVNVPATRIAGGGISTLRILSLGSGYWQSPYRYGSVIFYIGTAGCDNFTYCAFLAPKEMMAVDQKIDDGLPASGRAVSMRGNWAPAVNCTTSTDPTVAAYNIAVNTPECAFIFSKDF